MKVLIIDDSVSACEVVSAWLGAKQHDTDYFIDPDLGVAAFFKADYDLVITDVEMPGINGFQVAKKIRDNEKKWTPIVFMSVVAKENYYEKGIAAGGDYYLTKPLSETIFFAVLTGIQNMHEMRTDLEDSYQEIKNLKSQSIESFISIDTHGLILEVNPAVSLTFGHTEAELVGQNVNMLMFEDEAKKHNARLDAANSKPYNKLIVRREVVAKHKSGRQVDVEVSITPAMRHNKIIYTAILRDITNQKLNEEGLKKKAHYDELTGLPNRTLFYEHLNYALKLATRNEHKVGLFFIDLNRFKDINDTYGHDVGDEILVQVSKRLVSAVRDSDTVSRLGGDEFTVILERINGDATLAIVVDRVVTAFKKTFCVGASNMTINPSIGISISRRGLLDSDELVKSADIAMYKAKGKPNSFYQYYTEDLQEKSLFRIELIKSIDEAIKNDELKIYFQPKLSIDSKTLHGAEVLMRWENPKLGFISPVDFIPIMEETSIIVSTTEWLIEKSLRQWKSWIDSGKIHQDACVSINLSVKSILIDNFIAHLNEVFNSVGLPRKNVIFEVTESLMVNDPDKAREILTEIKRSGSKVSLDDFGTGYSSLSYLSEFPLDEVKIDKSFIDKMPTSSRDRSILKAIINMVHDLDLYVVAEGVDTEKKRRFLEAKGCDVYQGFLFSPALSADDFIKLITESKLN